MQSSTQHNRTWFFLHTLATIGAVAVVLGFSFLFYVASLGHLPKVDFPLSVRIFGSLSVIALLWLWIRMLVDFFKQRPPKHPVAWGFFLILGSYIAGLAYFWAIWRPKNKQNT